MAWLVGVEGMLMAVGSEIAAVVCVGVGGGGCQWNSGRVVAEEREVRRQTTWQRSFSELSISGVSQVGSALGIFYANAQLHR